MTSSTVYAPGEKTHRDENFPVASYLISKKYRIPVLAFYTFARAADDIADHPDLSEREKLLQLDAFEATLLGRNDSVAAALPLREALSKHHLTARHALDLLIAFRQDASKPRYANWDELMQYCSYSAAPVGRFVLDVHGGSPSLWPQSDALCAVLQIINHLQDCKADYQRLNRIYIPHDAMAFYHLPETVLAGSEATPELRQCLMELVKKTQALMQGAYFSQQVKDIRLALEVATIERLAERLLAVLVLRDPLSQRVHLNKFQLMSVMAQATLATLVSKLTQSGK